MNRSHWNRRCLGLAVLIGTMLPAAYPARAQDNATPRADTPAVGQARGDPEGNRAGVRTRINLNQAGDYASLVDALIVKQAGDPADELLGATLQPVGDALRAQLDIPAGQGLLVASVREGGPSAQAGLQQNDVLLSLADKPLAAAADLGAQLKAAGESAVPLKVLRAGKPVTLQVRPVYRVTLGPVQEPKTEYYIGVSIDPADEALRAQLGLPPDRGVLVTDVLSGTPAEKAGVKKYDVVLELGGKAVNSPENLARQVQANRDQPTTLKVLRGGKPVTIPVTATVRKAQVSPSEAEALQFWIANELPVAQTPQGLFVLQNGTRWATTVSTQDLRQRLERLEKELKALHEAVEKNNELLKAGKPPKGD